MQAFLAGFGLGLSLIIAIGAQNAFVLRQGLLRAHVFWMALFCAVSDSLLIAAGVAGFGALATHVPWFESVMRYGGAAFLAWYGWRNARSAWRGSGGLQAASETTGSLRAALLTLMALTWLNPHVYLDTVVLLGSISAQYDNRLAFGIGACTGSFVWFFGLAYGAQLLRPVFASPLAWRILDGVIAATMWAIAASLLWH